MAGRVNWLTWPAISMAPDIEAVAEQVFAALADPARRVIPAALATGGPASATGLAARPPITRQAIARHLALMAGTGLVTPEPGERRRIRYHLRPAPFQLAQQFLAALASDRDDRLDALKHHLTAGRAKDRRVGARADRATARPGIAVTCSLATANAPVSGRAFAKGDREWSRGIPRGSRRSTISL
jgi:DNA-binding transcriptional ArsR family regulator